MARSKTKKPEDCIRPLLINGMQGRMLRLPPPADKKREILFVYGHHSTLERWFGPAEYLNEFGGVTAPDLPGFGGMETLYKIGEQPDIDTLADYLASFIKLFYKRRRVTIFGLSFGFVVVTRMLQRYPEIAKKVDLLVSVVGFAHKDDFAFSKRRYQAYLLGSKFFSGKWRARLMRYAVLNRFVLRSVYAKTHNAKRKFENMSAEEFQSTMNTEIELWHKNDVRTHFHTGKQFLQLNNCNKQVDLPVWHIHVKDDGYFDNNLVEQHFRVIFTDYTGVLSRMKGHGPSVIATKKEAKPLFPQKLRRELSKD